MNWWDLIVFFWPALVIGGALALAGSAVGTFVLLRRDSLLALAIPEVVALGAAVAMKYGWSSSFLAALAAVLVALVLLAWTRLRRQEGLLLPCLYIGALCASFLLIANAGRHLEDLQNFLMGIDVAVTPTEAAYATPALLVAAVIAVGLWRRWLLLAQSPTTAQLARLYPVLWELLFLCLLGLVVLVGTHAMGVVMVLALLFLPAAAVLPWARRIAPAIVLAMIVAELDFALGFYLSNTMTWPFSQSVGGVGFALFLLSHIVGLLVR
ncbi:MAG TPA: metal ABC transporter permease [Tepidisphaeraceae bacterium]